MDQAALPFFRDPGLARATPRAPYTPAYRVITGPGEWSGAFADPPPVDLGRYVVLDVARGECPSGGYAVRIEAVRRQPDGCRVELSFRDPGPDEMVIMVLTAPRDAVCVDRARLGKPPWRFVFVDAAGRELATVQAD